jgi:hypothetical protein
MQNTKRHNDFDPIPEGLEFRQEYLDAALGQYRQTKRAIFVRRMAYLGVALLLLISGSIGLVKFSNPSETPAVADSTLTSTQQNSIQNTSPTIDLEMGEGVINEHSSSPAVESVEAAQDLSSRTTDQGDSMSSGVGLPGQLSHLQPKVTPKQRSTAPAAALSAQRAAAQAIATQKHNDGQDNTIPTPEQSSIPVATAYTIAYLEPAALAADEGLIHGRPSIAAPLRAWSFYAAAGLKLWADHGFHNRPFAPDASLALGVGYRLNNRLTAQLQSQFNTISGVANPYVVEQRTYDTGFNSTTYRYYTDRFYQIGAALGVQTNLAGNHSIGLGWSTYYLLTTDNHIETGIASTYETLQETRIAAKGYVEGFEAIRHSIRLNYEYALGKSKSIGMCYEHGLTDITKNSYFGNTIDRNSMLSVYFRVKLIP